MANKGSLFDRLNNLRHLAHDRGVRRRGEKLSYVEDCARNKDYEMPDYKNLDNAESEAWNTFRKLQDAMYKVKDPNYEKFVKPGDWSRWFEK